MPVFWGRNNRRDRHDNHDHHTHVTTSGARVIETHDNAHGYGRSVVAVPATNVSSTYVTQADGGHRRHHRSSSRREPSTIHGLWTKFLGTITGNRRRRRRGERETRRARENRQALRTARQAQRVRDNGHTNKLRKFYRRRHRKRSHHRDEPAVVVAAQDAGRSHRRTPWGHYSGRTLPSYHGAHHRIFGFFAGGRERRARGKAMAIAAEEERRRERRRRRDEMHDHGRRLRERRWF